MNKEKVQVLFKKLYDNGYIYEKIELQAYCEKCKKLYNQTVQLAKEKNIDNIELMVWGFNENAIKFYETLGMSIKNLRFKQKIQ